MNIEKILLSIDLLPQTGEIWPLEKELRDFIDRHQAFRLKFIEYLNESIQTFTNLQTEIFEEIKQASIKKNTFLKKKIEVNDILTLINPKINNWNEYLKGFKRVFDPIYNKLKNYIRMKIVSDEKFEEGEEKKNRDIIMLYKNIGILINWKEIFNEIKDEEIKRLTEKNFEDNDLNDCIKTLGLLGFLN